MFFTILAVIGTIVLVFTIGPSLPGPIGDACDSIADGFIDLWEAIEDLFGL